MHLLVLTSILLPLAGAFFTVEDPGDSITKSQWAGENAFLPDFSAVPANLSGVASDQVPARFYLDFNVNESLVVVGGFDQTPVAHESICLVDGGGTVKFTHTRFRKTGGPEFVSLATAFGLNSALNLANHTNLLLDHADVETHNGAIGCFATQSSRLSFSHSRFITTGPNGHAAYLVAGSQLEDSFGRYYTGGRMSALIGAGDGGNTVRLVGTTGSTEGIGSPLVLAEGSGNSFNITGLVGEAKNAPGILLNGDHGLVCEGCIINGHAFGGVAVFGPRPGLTSTLEFSSSYIRGSEAAAAFWFGSTFATVVLGEGSTVWGEDQTAVLANNTQLTQDYSAYGNYSPTSVTSPAMVNIISSGSTLLGNIVADYGSKISVDAVQNSTIHGATWKSNGAQIDMNISKDTEWTLNYHSRVDNFENEDIYFTNIKSGGYNLYYAKNAPRNGWLKGLAWVLPGNGTLIPE